MNTPDQNCEADIDRWLEDALARYTRVEPRPGLEARLLARVAEKRRESRSNLRWWGALALTTACLLAAALLWRERPVPVGLQQPVANVVSSDKQTQASTSRSSGETASRYAGIGIVVAPGKPRRALAVHGQSAEPKLDRFPAPTPLSEQERLLARYVREYPQRAILMARVQTEFRQLDEREMAAPWPAVTNSTELEEHQ